MRLSSTHLSLIHIWNADRRNGRSWSVDGWQIFYPGGAGAYRNRSYFIPVSYTHLDVYKRQQLLLILISSALVSNVVLSQFLGLCPFLGVSKKVETAAGMGTAVIFVITLSSGVAGAIYKFILTPLNIQYLQTIVFILVIAALVQFVEMFLKKYMKSLYEALGVYLPLITTNCAVLGVALTNVQKEYGIFTGMVNGFATALGFTISIVILAGIREKLEYNDYPESFKGMPMVLVTAGLMAIAFCGFSGLL